MNSLTLVCTAAALFAIAVAAPYGSPHYRDNWQNDYSSYEKFDHYMPIPYDYPPPRPHWNSYEPHDRSWCGKPHHHHHHRHYDWPQPTPIEPESTTPKEKHYRPEPTTVEPQSTTRKETYDRSLPTTVEPSNTTPKETYERSVPTTVEPQRTTPKETYERSQPTTIYESQSTTQTTEKFNNGEVENKSEERDIKYYEKHDLP